MELSFHLSHSTTRSSLLEGYKPVWQIPKREARRHIEMIPYGTMQEAEGVLGRNMTWAEAAWFRYSAAMPDSWLMCHNALAFAIVFLVVPLPLILLEQFAPAVALRYKLQPKVRPLSASAHLRSIVVAGRNMLILYAPHQLIYLITFKIAEVRTGIPLPSAGEVVAKMVVYALLEDYFSYWVHRFLHIKWAYRNIHYVHHEITAPTGFNAVYAHWADLNVSTITIIIYLAMVPCHVTVHWLWYAVRAIENLESHCGYDFPFNPKRFIPFYGGAEFHDYHHRLGGGRNSNLAPIFTYCDYIYGTHKGYRYNKAS